MNINKILIITSVVLAIVLMGLTVFTFRKKASQTAANVSPVNQGQQVNSRGNNPPPAPTWSSKQILLMHGINTTNVLTVQVNQEFIFNNADFIPYDITLNGSTTFTLEPRSYKAFTYTTPQTLTFDSPTNPRIKGTITVQ